MRYLITGGCGFIGSHLAEALLAAGHEVMIIDDLSNGKRGNVPLKATVHIADVATRGAFDMLLPQVDACFHLAAIASVEQSRTQWLRTHQVNAGGMVNLLEAIARSGRKLPVVYASSAAVYGHDAVLPLMEIGTPDPLSAYATDKLACEHHARVASLVHGIPTTGLRFFNVYGPRQDPESPYSGVIAIFLGQLLRNRPITIFGDGSQTRDFIYVSDVVRGLVQAMQALQQGHPAGEVYNICCGKQTTVLELAQTLSKVLGVEPRLQYAAPRLGEVRASMGDPSLAQTALGFRAEVKLEDGLRQTIGVMEAAA